MPELTLRALNPQTELDLFHEAFSWRQSPKRNTRVNRMSFEDFAADDPHRVVMGLFNSHLCAVYMFIEVAPKVMEAHFTCRKDVPTEDVFAGGKTMLNWFHSQGAEVRAWIVERNRPLRAFAEALGFQPKLKAEVCGRFSVIEYVSKKGD